MTMNIRALPGSSITVWRVMCALLALLLIGGGVCADRLPADRAAHDGEIIAYEPRLYPGIECIAGRVIAETHPSLSDSERAQLWRDYGLRASFEWISHESGFSYCELEVEPHSLADYAAALLKTQSLPAPRRLSALVPLLCEDPRVSWAAPDALILEWADSGAGGLEDIISEIERSDSVEGVPEELEHELQPEPDAPRQPSAQALASGSESISVSLLDEQFRAFLGSLPQWEALAKPAPPLPDFAYYCSAPPEGLEPGWPAELSGSAPFAGEFKNLYGTGQAEALETYRALGSPDFASVTVCVADTGVLFNHPELKGSLHPNSIDTNYRNYRIASSVQRPSPQDELTDRESDSAVGLPREAIKGRPASHGTQVAGVVRRCTAGFTDRYGSDSVRILPASVKSASTARITGWRVKSPISAFVKLIALLSEEFPTGEFAPDSSERVQNSGDVRVVTVSASVPKSYFSETEWRIVANLAGKAAGSIAEDLRHNDRVYLFAAGNEAQSEPNQPCDQSYVIGVAAASGWSASEAWQLLDLAEPEGSNLGMKCVSAPGWGILTSDIYACPNLAYLPKEEIRTPRPQSSVPPRRSPWEMHSNRFSATSSATPQVAALAALLYAQEPQRDYREVIALIEESCGDRVITAPYGQARGLIDYRTALGYE